MSGLAPSSGESAVVTGLTVVGVLLALGLLGGLAVLRRGRTGAGQGVARPVHGLVVVAVIGAVALFYAGRFQFAAVHPRGRFTLFQLHGTDTPVYWIAFMVGAGMLVLLTGILLRWRRTLAVVVGPPALLVAGLLVGLLVAFWVKVRRLDARLAAEQLPALPPVEPISDGAAVGASVGLGWLVAVVGVVLLALVVVLVLVPRQEVLVAGAVVAALTLPGAVAPPDTGYWGLRGGVAERVVYSAFDLGGWGLLWPVVIVGPAVLVCAIPFLPNWIRGLATIVAVAAPVWILVGLGTVQSVVDRRLPELLRADGFSVASRLSEVMALLLLVAPTFAVPAVAIRGWRAGRRARAQPVRSSMNSSLA